MRLYFKQRFFSWLDSYDVYDEAGNTAFTVEGKLSWGHRLHINDCHGIHIGTLQERVFTLLPQFELYVGEDYIGRIRKEFSFFKPRFTIECNGWEVDGNWLEWDYAIREGQRQVASIQKEIFNLTDTYVIDVAWPDDALLALMVVLAIDAEKCSRD